MKKATLALVCVLFGGVALAQPATFVEIALIDGGENGRNGSGNQSGFEATGDVGLGDNWYAGGILGRFTRESTGGDTRNSYFNAHAGYLAPVSERTGAILEVGLWFGDQKNPGDPTTNPTALELKAGVNQSLSEKFSIFGTLAWVTGDFDTPQNSNLRNYVWSLGGAYSFGNSISINLKVVNGVNGVNGQDQVLRFGARYTFGRGKGS